MKYTFAIAALAALTTSQSISDLPSCSLTCVVNGVTGLGCGVTDFECACTKADQLTPVVTPCVQQACPSTADQQKVITTLEGICASAGFPIDIPTPGASSSAAPTSAAPTSAAPSETKAESSSVGPTIQTSVPTPSFTDVVISSGYPVPTSGSEDTCAVVTVTVTQTSSSVVPPYPTVPLSTGVPPVPSGTGVQSAPPTYFTGAASAVKVPASIAGMLGLAAFVL
ncbi:hypothetical protein N0V90_004869 [Kalmusia sp. IMI 367209]|nr:hypothetical protein N0V90_004869 [Kalmusia sp. IMI 367209]